MSDVYRTGRHVGRTVYRQRGAVPADGDELIGMLDTPELAAFAVAAMNRYPAVGDAPKPASRLAVGVTCTAVDMAQHLPAYPGAAACRVFSSTGPPPWTDARILALKAAGVTPFVSFKTYDVQAFDGWLRSKPADVPQVYVAHHHEPEADLTPAAYVAQQKAMWSVVQGLPANLRAQVRFGPVQTLQWTENTRGRSYITYDPGIGDFWGVDAYVNTWGPAYPDPAKWLARVLAYDTGGRERWIPELGVISMPDDVRDVGRAAWITNLADVLLKSDVRLALWWCALGAKGGPVDGVGSIRDFHLEERYTTAGGQVALNPAPSADAWRALMARAAGAR